MDNEFECTQVQCWRAFVPCNACTAMCRIGASGPLPCTVCEEIRNVPISSQIWALGAVYVWTALLWACVALEVIS